MLYITTILCASFGAGPLLPPSPTLDWRFVLEAPLRGGMTVGDMHSSAGLETALIDQATGSVLLVDAKGELLWAYDGAFRKAASGAPAFVSVEGAGRLLVVNDAGGAVSLGTEDGALVWEQTEELVPGGAPVWADLDDDEIPEAIVAGPGGVVALTASGELSWRYAGEELDRELALLPGACVGDVNEDRYPEIFLADRWGLLCLDGTGYPLWEKPFAEGLAGLPVAAALGEGAEVQVVFGTVAPPMLIAADGLTGDVLWRRPLPAPVSEGLLIADLEGDEGLEVAALTANGELVVVDGAGISGVRWRSPEAAGGAMTAGDVDGDGRVEVVARSGGHVYVLGGGFDVEHQVASASTEAVVLANLRGDGYVRWLEAAPEHTLRAWRLPRQSDAALLAWPMARQNAGQTGFVVPRAEPLELTWVEEEVSLLRNGGFEWSHTTAARVDEMPEEIAAQSEEGATPRGWSAEVGTLRWEGGGVEGNALAHAMPEDEGTRVVSEMLTLPFGARTLDASVLARGDAAMEAQVVLLNGAGIVGRLELEAGAPREDAWREYRLAGAVVPDGAAQAQIVLSSEGEAWWDDAKLSVQTRALPQGGVLLNQLGYDTGSPKRLVVWSNIAARSASFEILDSTARVVLGGSLPPGQRVTGAYGGDWGAWYHPLDFTTVNLPGTYTLRVTLDGLTIEPAPIRIEMDLVWGRLLDLLVAGIRAHRCVEGGVRCEAERPELAGIEGGWHDGSWLVRRDNAAIAYDLLTSFAAVRWRFVDAEGNVAGPVPLLEEALYGADYVAAEAEALLDAGAAPEELTLHAAVLARAARYAGEEQAEQYWEAATGLVDAVYEGGARDAHLFNAVMDLFVARREDRHKALATELRPQPTEVASESLLDYENELDPQSSQSFKLALHLEGEAKALAAQGANPFGLFPMGELPDDYFATPDLALPMPRGNTAAILRAAELAAKSYRFAAHPELGLFIMAQLDWLCGVNPFGLCLIEGAGETGLPAWYRPYAEGVIERGAVPGAVAAGISGTAPGDDRPYVDLRTVLRPVERTNAHHLRDTSLLLQVLSRMKRTPS